MELKDQTDNLGEIKRSLHIIQEVILKVLQMEKAMMNSFTVQEKDIEEDIKEDIME